MGRLSFVLRSLKLTIGYYCIAISSEYNGKNNSELIVDNGNVINSNIIVERGKIDTKNNGKSFKIAMKPLLTTAVYLIFSGEIKVVNK